MDWLAILGIELAKALLPVLVAALVGLAVSWAKVQIAEAQRRAPDVVWELGLVAERAVKAAEQAGLSGLIRDKKSYALECAEGWLAAKHINIDLHLIDAAIEAAVYSEINKGKEAKAGPVGFIPGDLPK